MATTKSDISRWFRAGKVQKATHLIVVMDGFDHEDYPKYVEVGQDVRKIVAEYKTNQHPMQSIVEVYDLSMDMESQLNEFRAFHL